MSRSTAITAATTNNAAAVAPDKSSTSGRVSANGRISPAQPSGVAHRSHLTSPPLTEAAVRRASATTSTPVEIPVASRFVGAS